MIAETLVQVALIGVSQGLLLDGEKKPANPGQTASRYTQNFDPLLEAAYHGNP